MTGRDGGAALEPIDPSPVVVLVRPQLADNIGAVARCMANGGLFHLRLVAPRDGWPQDRAWRMASGADRILDQATVHETVADAVADLHRVYATCPRPRHVIKPLLTARAAAVDVRAAEARGLRTGILFGPERAGLDNDDMAQADTLVRYPLNPAFDSLNLAQAVMVMAYEWWTAADDTPPLQKPTHKTAVAGKAELEHFLVHLIDQLDACGFLRNAPKRPGMVQNIRHLFQRGEVTEQELRTLHGMVAGLALGRRRLGRFEDDLAEHVETLRERGLVLGAVHELSPGEDAVARQKAAEGAEVIVVSRGPVTHAGFRFDGVEVELKIVSGVRRTDDEGLSSAIASRIMDSRGQSPNVLVDATAQAGMTLRIAERAIKRAVGTDRVSGDKLRQVTVTAQDGKVEYRRL